MFIDSKNDKILLGTGAGSYILKRIEGARKEIKIVSPYLTPSYIEKILALAHKGVRVTLITSDEIKEGDGRFSQLSNRHIVLQQRTLDDGAKKERDIGLLSAGLGLAVSVGFLIYSGVGILLLGLLAISGFFFWKFYTKRIYTYQYDSPLKLRVFVSPRSHLFKQAGMRSETPNAHLVHAKVYVIDEEVAFVGSVNFTHDGLYKNYESCVTVLDKTAISAISKEVDSLFHSKDNCFLNLNDWGRQVYGEPPN